MFNLKIYISPGIKGKGSEFKTKVDKILVKSQLNRCGTVP